MAAEVQAINSSIVTGPHNGTPEYQVWDEERQEMIGGQVQMILGSLRNRVYSIAVGRRVGKTTMRPFLWMEKASLTKGVFRAGFIAQDHTKAHEMFEFCQKMWGDNPRAGTKGIITEVVGDPKTQRRYIRTMPIGQPGLPQVNEGMEIWFWSGAHPHYEKIRGYMVPFHHIDLDECSLLHEKILNVVNPMLLEAGGTLCLTGTPDCDGIGAGWFEQYFNNGLSEDDPRYAKWGSMNAPSMCNPLVDAEAIEQLKASCRTSEDWEQEGLARFLTGRGSVFSRLDEVMCLEPRPTLPAWYEGIHSRVYGDNENSKGEGVSAWVGKDPTPNHRYVIAVDWARVRDATVISVIDATTMEQVCLMRLQGEDYEEGVAWVSELRSAYNNATIHSDANGVGDAMTRTLQRRYGDGCVAHKFNSHNKAAYVRDTQMLFNHLEVKMLKVQFQRTEFKLFRKEKSETTGKVRYTHPPNGTDDSVDALLMVAEALRAGSKKPKPEKPTGPAWLSVDWINKKRKNRRMKQRLRTQRRL